MSNNQQLNAALYSNGTWQRWEMDAFEVARENENTSIVQAPEQPTVLPNDVLEQIKQLELSVRQQAKTAGYSEGYKEGQSNGFAEGKADGLATGNKEGYDTGLAAGYNDGQKQAKAQAQQLQTMLDSCTKAIESIEAEVGQALISLAINIAQQVIRSTLSAEPEKILETVHDIVHIDSNQDAILRLRINPNDLALIQESLADDRRAKNWRIESDDTIERGGCIAETALGCIDATLQTRWQRATSTLGRHYEWMRQ